MSELLFRLPMMLKQSVRVEGRLIAWGDLAAFDSEISREVMVDLRPLPEMLRAAINATCTSDTPCSGTVLGTVKHLRGEGISELGIEADDITYQRMSAP